MDERIAGVILLVVIYIVPFTAKKLVKSRRLHLTRQKIKECMNKTSRDNNYELLNDVMDIAVKEDLYEKLGSDEAYERRLRVEEYFGKILEDYRNYLNNTFFEKEGYLLTS